MLLVNYMYNIQLLRYLFILSIHSLIIHKYKTKAAMIWIWHVQSWLRVLYTCMIIVVEVATAIYIHICIP